MDGSVLAMDLGTTAVKAAAVGPDGTIWCRAARPAPAIEGPDARFSVHSYLETAIAVLGELASQAGDGVHALETLALSSQRATVLLEDAAGQPLGPAWSWQGSSCDAAGAALSAALRSGCGAALS